MRSIQKSLIAVIAVLALVSMSVSEVAAATITVRSSDVGVSWFMNDTRTGGSVSFVDSSLQVTTTDANGTSQAKAQLVNYGYIGTPLSSIYALSYDALRSSGSTNSAAQTISLNIEVDFVGDGSSYTTLVFEPVYQSGGVGAMAIDTWQTWDAYAGGGATWWSTKDIPGVCAFNCFVSWSDIVASNPDAVVVGLLGFNVGSGWAGNFVGYADWLTVNDTTYDFESDPPLIGPPTSKDECKKSGWQTFNNPPFKNQGDCVSFVASGQ